MNSNLILAGSIQKVAFISQTLPVERGIRHVQVSARLNPVSYSLYGLSLPPVSYSSAEAIVNLRVMDRGRVVCSDRISLERLMIRQAGSYNFIPKLLILNFDNAIRAAETNQGSGLGVIKISYTDDQRLAGDYTLYVRIRRV